VAVMSAQDKAYKLVFKGEILPGFELDTVKINVAKLFKTDVAKIERLFSGSRVVIKDNIDLATAKKYEMAMQSKGAVCSIVSKFDSAKVKAVNDPEYSSQDDSSPGDPPPASAHQPENNVDIDSWMKVPSTVSDEESENIQYEGKNETVNDMPDSEAGSHSEGMDDVTIAPPGTTIVKAEEVPTLEVDTSALSMAEPGEKIMEHEPVEEPDIDTDSLQMLEPGAKLGDN
jgi:hypothetical protein